MLSWGVTGSRQQWTADRRQQPGRKAEQLRCGENPEGRPAHLYTDVVTLLSPFVTVAGEPPDSQETEPSATEVSYHIKSQPLPPPGQPGAGI